MLFYLLNVLDKQALFLIWFPQLNLIFTKKGNLMNIHFSIGPMLALFSGIIILFAPKLLNYIVAIYLIITGILGLFGTGHIRL